MSTLECAAHAQLPMLRHLRLRRNLTPRQLAAAAGCSETAVRNAESSRCRSRGISLGTARALADALGTTVDILQSDGLVAAWQRQRMALADLLLSYRAIPYRRGELSRQAQREQGA